MVPSSWAGSSPQTTSSTAEILSFALLCIEAVGKKHLCKTCFVWVWLCRALVGWFGVGFVWLGFLFACFLTIYSF